MEKETLMIKQYTQEELEKNDKTEEICGLFASLLLKTKNKFDSEKMSFDQLELNVSILPLSERYSLITNINIASMSNQVQAESTVEFTPSIIDYQCLVAKFREKYTRQFSNENLKVEFDDDGVFLQFIKIFKFRSMECKIIETKIIVKQLIWCPELLMDWSDIDFRKDFAPPKPRPSITNSFYDLQDPEEGYILRGVGPVVRKILDREHDVY